MEIGDLQSVNLQRQSATNYIFNSFALFRSEEVSRDFQMKLDLENT